MRKRRVAVVCIHSLFGRGLAQLLKSDEELEVTCLTAGAPGTSDTLKCLEPDAIVVEEGEETGFIREAVRDLPPALFIGVRPNDNTINVYQEWQVQVDDPSDLVDAVHTSFTMRRPGVTSQP